jgi:hypothetical protein
MLRMDESKSETNVKRCGECVVICYIFCVMYEKIVFDIMYLIIKSVWVNGSGCLVSYVNIVALLNIIQNQLTATFVSLRVLV